MSDILTREQVEQLHVFTQPEFPEQVKYATAVRILIENDAALRQQLEQVTQDLEAQRTATYQAVEREHAAKQQLADARAKVKESA